MPRRGRSTRCCARCPRCATRVTTINSGQAAGQDLRRASTCAWSTARTASAASTRCRCRCASGCARMPGHHRHATSACPTSAAATSLRVLAPGHRPRASWSGCRRLITAKLRPIPGLVDLDTSLKPDKPTVAIEVRRDAASDARPQRGNMLASTLRTLVAGTDGGQLARARRRELRRQRAPGARRAATRIGDLQRMPINIAAGAPTARARIVRLSQVADVRAVDRPEPDQPARPEPRGQRSTPTRSAAAAGDVSADIRKRARRASAGRPATATSSAARPRT